jgi:hypothetical protein
MILAIDPGTDKSAYVIGVLCKRGHEHENTGKSLRYKSGACVLCQSENAKHRRSIKGREMDQKRIEWGKCNHEKQLTYFRNSYKKNRDKRLEWNRNWRRANLESCAEKMREYRKEHPDIMARLEAKRERPPEYKHKFCQYNMKWKKQNPDRRLASYQRRRARTKGKVTSSELTELRTTQNGKCFYCNCDLDNNGRGHLDHKTPLVKGGLHEISNLVFACSTCNLRKATKTAEEYLDIISR